MSQNFESKSHKSFEWWNTSICQVSKIRCIHLWLVRRRRRRVDYNVAHHAWHQDCWGLSWLKGNVVFVTKYLVRPEHSLPPTYYYNVTIMTITCHHFRSPHWYRVSHIKCLITDVPKPKYYSTQFYLQTIDTVLAGCYAAFIYLFSYNNSK